MNNVIYMDNHATTPIAPEVLAAMLPYITMNFGNASSTHPFGVRAKDAVEKARQQVAELLGCSEKEIVFTSGATESDNLAIKGIAYACREKGNHIITSTAEHHAILDTCHALAAEGFETTYLPVDKYGRVSPDDVEAAITPKTILMSFMYANNEVGTINPITDIAAVAAKHGVLFHSDAVQGIGQLPANMEMLGVNLASLTAHKIYGPKGIGALYIQRNTSQPHSLFHGGGQEAGVRPGTLNVAGIVGLGAACELSKNYMETGKNRVASLRDALHQKLNARLEDLHLNGHPEQRLPGNLNLCFAGVQSHAHLAGLKRVAVSTGSACDSESVKASHVLVAMRVPNELALTAVRFGLGRYNTAEEVDVVADEVVKVVNRLRALAPEW
ncbi:cysteine desulfurase [Candidatus Poribacteria bacterium]|nr:cysteine desulfurase [Candidatus Poribacteria bacterium]MYG08546.1 cysteine desulfurase [Candidatus Poribacteria bacterium]MYK24890.1 cysteine desulfurase [Candidatus Poribacteria bacterium]